MKILKIEKQVTASNGYMFVVGNGFFGNKREAKKHLKIMMKRIG